jgi:hypothetical protein
MNECTTIDNPFCLYDADRNKDITSFKGPGVLVCSIDNMPTQLPRESTDFFGELLLPYVPDILQSDAKKPLEDHEFSPAVHDVSTTVYCTLSCVYLSSVCCKSNWNLLSLLSLKWHLKYVNDTCSRPLSRATGSWLQTLNTLQSSVSRTGLFYYLFSSLEKRK